MSHVPEWHQFPPNKFNVHSWLIKDPVIGDGTWIGPFCVIDGSGGLHIGTNCDIAAGAQIYSHSTLRNVLSGRSVETDRAPTVIGDNCHVGAGAIILMGAKIGNNCLVAAGAVVKQFTEAPPWSVLIGVPARVLVGEARKFVAGDGLGSLSAE